MLLFLPVLRYSYFHILLIIMSQLFNGNKYSVNFGFIFLVLPITLIAKRGLDMK